MKDDRKRNYVGLPQRRQWHPLRRRVLSEAHALLENQTLPAGVARPQIYAGVLGADMRLSPNSAWLQAYAEVATRRRGALLPWNTRRSGDLTGRAGE